MKLFNLGNRYFGLIIIVIDCGDAGDVVIYVSYNSYSNNNAMRFVCLHLRGSDNAALSLADGDHVTVTSRGADAGRGARCVGSVDRGAVEVTC